MYNNNKPVSAKIPHALYEAECSMDSSLGEGTILMLTALLRYVSSKIQTVKHFQFDDMSHIDCVEKDVTQPVPRRPIKPLHLAYFSIAYNSETWYEKHFKAELIDKIQYRKYRERLDFLVNPTKKIGYIEFLEIAKPNPELYTYLEKLYTKSSTYRDFFVSIPKTKRCNIVYSWLVSFMEYYLKDVFTTNGWEIDITRMYISGGTYKKKQEIYPSNYRLVSYTQIHSL